MKFALHIKQEVFLKGWFVVYYYFFTFQQVPAIMQQLFGFLVYLNTRNFSRQIIRIIKSFFFVDCTDNYLLMMLDMFN